MVPSRSLGLALHPAEFRISTRYRLGLPVYPSSSSCPACGGESDRFGDHAIGCGGDFARIGRHDRLRDVLLHTAAAAALTPRREVQISSASQSRPADLFLPSWRRGQPAALDVTVISSLQPATVTQAAHTPGHALKVAARRKNAAHLTSCSRAGVNFIPLAVEALGGWATEAIETICDLARFLGQRSASLSDSSPRRHLFQRLSVTLQKGNAQLLLLRVPSIPTLINGIL